MSAMAGVADLNGDDLGTVEIGNPGQAGTHRLVVDYDHAGPALTLAVAGLYGSGETQVFAQQIQQDCPWFSDLFMPDAVDADSNLFHHIYVG